MSNRPATGARFLLERLAEHEADAGALATATYRATVFTPDAEFTATATLRDDGTFELPATGAPEDLHDGLSMQARLIARGAAKRREDGLGAWPTRVLRWRGPGRG
ncbi:MAG: hypothetical protein H0V17_04565 [Deltaproteobacteria bacterium]|nr:hypothetical protein [Deltaproteobacteria bacterium]